VTKMTRIGPCQTQESTCRQGRAHQAVRPRLSGAALVLHPCLCSHGLARLPLVPQRLRGAAGHLECAAQELCCRPGQACGVRGSRGASTTDP